MKKPLIAIIVLLLQYGYCSAQEYPKTVNLKNRTTYSDKKISYSYKFNKNMEKEYRQQLKKKLRNNIRFITISIRNKTNRPINISNELEFYAGDIKIHPLDNASINQITKKKKNISFPMFQREDYSELDDPLNYMLLMAIEKTLSSNTKKGKRNRVIFSECNLAEKTILPNSSIIGLLAFDGITTYNSDLKIIIK